MFGDDPNRMVTTVQVGFGGVFGHVREESRELTREVRLGLEVGSGLCRRSREEREGKPDNSFRRLKTSDDLTGYIVAIVIRWGIKRTLNVMKLGRRPTYTIKTPLANFHPILRTFLGHL